MLEATENISIDISKGQKEDWTAKKGLKNNNL